MVLVAEPWVRVNMTLRTKDNQVIVKVYITMTSIVMELVNKVWLTKYFGSCQILVIGSKTNEVYCLNHNS